MGAATLRRYTNLVATIHLLRSRKLTLLSPNFWSDRNDAFYMSEYKKRKKASCLAALCFAETAETYHHWQVFASGVGGVCIQFDKNRLAALAAKSKGFRMKQMIYKKIVEIEGDPLQTEDLPFLKRWPYKPESEIRLIVESTKIEADTFDLEIDLNCVERVVLSPWMPESLLESVGETLWAIEGCANLKITRSTLIDNERWRRAATGDHESLRSK